MAEPITNPEGQETTQVESGEKTFTQAEVDALIAKEKAKATAKATKGMPSAEELAAYQTWKDSQQTEQERYDALKGERDTLSGKLSSLEGERDQLRHEMYVLQKGYSGDEAEFIVFKANKMVSEDTTFEQAVDAILADRKDKPHTSLTAPVGRGPASGMSLGERINRQLRSN
jgi:hypothetical protein